MHPAVGAAPRVERSWSSDIFSLGCVMAELFDGGQELFDLSSLLRYRNDPASLPSSLLNRICNAEVKVGAEAASHADADSEHAFAQRPRAADGGGVAVAVG